MNKGIILISVFFIGMGIGLTIMSSVFQYSYFEFEENLLTNPSSLTTDSIRDAMNNIKNAVIISSLGTAMFMIGLAIFISGFVSNSKPHTIIGNPESKRVGSRYLTPMTAKKEAEFQCPQCGKKIPSDAKLCPYCALEFQDNKTAVCGNCEKEIPSDANMCPYCGVEL